MQHEDHVVSWQGANVVLRRTIDMIESRRPTTECTGTTIIARHRSPRTSSARPSPAGGLRAPAWGRAMIDAACTASATGTNAQTVADILRVLFPDARTVLDTTYGRGRFWSPKHPSHPSR